MSFFLLQYTPLILPVVIKPPGSRQTLVFHKSDSIHKSLRMCSKLFSELSIWIQGTRHDWDLKMVPSSACFQSPGWSTRNRALARQIWIDLGECVEARRDIGSDPIHFGQHWTITGESTWNYLKDPLKHLLRIFPAVNCMLTPQTLLFKAYSINPRNSDMLLEVPVTCSKNTRWIHDGYIMMHLEPPSISRKQ